MSYPDRIVAAKIAGAFFGLCFVAMIVLFAHAEHIAAKQAAYRADRFRQLQLLMEAQRRDVQAAPVDPPRMGELLWDSALRDYLATRGEAA